MLLSPDVFIAALFLHRFSPRFHCRHALRFNHKVAAGSVNSLMFLTLPRAAHFLLRAWHGLAAQKCLRKRPARRRGVVLG
jgi:hypothetical protein